VSAVRLPEHPNKPGQPFVLTTEFKPTEQMRSLVLMLAGYGIPQREIVTLLPSTHTRKGPKSITEKTLRKHFARELAQGHPQCVAKVAESLFKKATGNGPQAVTAAIFWLKCQAGWKDHTRVDVEVTGKDGAPLITAEVLEQLADHDLHNLANLVSQIAALNQAQAVAGAGSAMFPTASPSFIPPRMNGHGAPPPEAAPADPDAMA